MNRAQAERLDLINKGETNPGVLENAMRSQITVTQSGRVEDKHLVSRTDHPAMEIIRKNDAVIGDLENLYRKAYYHLTGIATSGEMVVLDALGIPITPEDLYAKGLKPKNFEECIKILLQLRQEINKLAGVGNGAIVLEKVTETQKLSIPIEDLMAMRSHILESKKSGKVVEMPKPVAESPTGAPEVAVK